MTGEACTTGRMAQGKAMNVRARGRIEALPVDKVIELSAAPAVKA